MEPRRFAHIGWGRARLRSFLCALRGIREVLSTELHARIHAVATVVAGIVGWWLDLSLGEWALLVLAVALVWTAEAVNTSIERVVDLVSPDEHPLAGKAKDIAAGAVLIASIGAAAIGAIVFLPKIIARF